MYEEGRGVEKNEKKAAELFQKAANQGNLKAQFGLGQMYEEGRGVEKNETKAIEAYVNLINDPVFSKYRVYEKCLERLEKVLQKESEEGDWTQLVTDAFAQVHLGQMYLEGRGVKEDKKKAGQLFKKAANQGNRKALYCWGKMVYQGTGEQKEETNTFQLCMNQTQEHVFNISLIESSEREEIGKGSCGVVWRIQAEPREGVKIQVAVKKLKTNDKSKAWARGASNA